jgi:hypothetical protein
MRVIEEFNSGNETSQMGINKFSDWTKEEMKMVKGYKPMT